MIQKNNFGFKYYKTQSTGQFISVIKYIIFFCVYMKAKLNILMQKYFKKIFTLVFWLDLYNGPP
jgi:hypothetical protein